MPRTSTSAPGFTPTEKEDAMLQQWPGREGLMPDVPAAAPAPAVAPAGQPEAFDLNKWQPKSFRDYTPDIMDKIKQRRGEGGVKRAREEADRLRQTEMSESTLSQAKVGNENVLRGDYQKDASKFRTVVDSMGTIRSIYSGKVDDSALQRRFTKAKDATAARDMALVFSYMKAMDPGSTVREAEYANATNAAGVTERVKAVWAKLINGEILTPAQRADFIATAGDIYEGHLQNYQAIKNTYTGIAERQGLNPANVAIPYELQDYDPMQFRLDPAGASAPAPAVTAPKVPQVGEERKGYVFQGGDPSDPTAWRKK
jgi:hypothetical protein